MIYDRKCDSDVCSGNLIDLLIQMYPDAGFFARVVFVALQGKRPASELAGVSGGSSLSTGVKNTNVAHVPKPRHKEAVKMA
jgi:hypothetical protein